MFQRDHADVFIGPFALLVFYQPGKRQWTKHKVIKNSLRLYFIPHPWLVMPFYRTSRICWARNSPQKISLTSRQLTNGRLRVSAWRNLEALRRRPYLFFFPAWIYSMIQIHSGENKSTSRLHRSFCRDILEARSLFLIKGRFKKL